MHKCTRSFQCIQSAQSKTEPQHASTQYINTTTGAYLDVQVHQLLPVALLLAHAYEARNVEPLAKQLQVLHQLVRLELGIQDAQLGEDAHVSALQALQDGEDANVYMFVQQQALRE
jgi:hypothetical protein